MYYETEKQHCRHTLACSPGKPPDKIPPCNIKNKSNTEFFQRNDATYQNVEFFEMITSLWVYEETA